MTRGQMVLLKDNKVYSSNEYNGDMYMDGCGYGKEVLKRLNGIHTVDGLRKSAMYFGKKNFHYEYEKGWKPYLMDTGDMVCGKGMAYYDKWFSDYLYVKNADDHDRHVIDTFGKSWTLKPGERVVLNFGQMFYFCHADGRHEGFEDIEEEVM